MAEDDCTCLSGARFFVAVALRILPVELLL
jgi:hypothetical protein